MALHIPSKFWLLRPLRLSLYLKRSYTEIKENWDLEETKESPPSTLPFEGPINATLINGVPRIHQECRFVRIFQPSKNPMQSGTANVGHWQIAFDDRQRWENPNMGWCSTGDPLSNMSLSFSTKEQAAEFCERNGWEWYEAQSFTEKKYKIRSYASNFMSKRCRVSTK